MDIPDGSTSAWHAPAADPCRESFRHLYMLTHKRLFDVALQVVKDRSQAEQVLDEAFIKVWQQGAHAQVADGDAMTWLLAIARQTAVDKLHRQQRPA